MLNYSHLFGGPRRDLFSPVQRHRATEFPGLLTCSQWLGFGKAGEANWMIVCPDL
jgi:hypothetical protein